MPRIDRFLVCAFIMLMMSHGAAQAQFDADERAQASVVPEGVRRIISANFPGFFLPTANDLSGHWSDFQSHYAWLPYWAGGDFNDDGIKDYGALLEGSTEWKFVIFQGEASGEFTPTVVQRGEIPGKGLFRYPKAVRLHTIKKGETYSPEGADALVQFTIRRDSIEFRDDNRGTWLFQYANGHYTDFQWSRGPSLSLND